MTELERIETKARLEAFFETNYREDWMDDKYYEKFIPLLFSKINTTFNDMVDNLFIGVSNGYSIDFQFELMKKIIDKSRI